MYQICDGVFSSVTFEKGGLNPMAESTGEQLESAWSAYNIACEYHDGGHIEESEFRLKVASCQALLAIAEELRVLNRILNTRGGYP